MLKVLIVVTDEVSVKTFMKDFIAGLISAGFEITVITNTFDPDYLSKELGVNVIDAKMRRNPSPLNDFRSLTLISSAIKKIKPNTVIYATPKASLLASLVSKFWGVPKRIYLLWGLRLETTKGFSRWFYTKIEKIINANSTLVIAVSASLAERSDSLRLGKSPTVIGRGSSHGVDTHKFIPEIPHEMLSKEAIMLKIKLAEKFVVIFVGRICKDKGIDVLLDAAQILGADSGIHVLIVGQIEDELYWETISSRTDNKLFTHVDQTEDVKSLFAISSLHCLPTKREGFPNVTLEASAMGLPTITSNATGAIDSVIDGKTGYIFSVGKVEELKNRIMFLKDNKPLLEQMGLQARTFAVQNYDSDKVISSNIQFLRNHILGFEQ